MKTSYKKQLRRPKEQQESNVEKAIGWIPYSHILNVAGLKGEQKLTSMV